MFNYYNRNKLYGSIISYQYDILESGHCRMCNNWTIDHVITKLATPYILVSGSNKNKVKKKKKIKTNIK